MSDDKRKAAVKRSIEKYILKQTVKTTGVRRKNKKPEKEVEKKVMAWLKTNGFSCHVVEAKATWSKASNCYKSQLVAPGFPDICGCSANGLSVWIELKAPGKGRRPRVEQYEFLMDKIEKNCFAVCVDSVEILEKLWRDFCDYKTKVARIMYLKTMLNKPLNYDKDNGFNDELGF